MKEIIEKRIEELKAQQSQAHQQATQANAHATACEGAIIELSRLLTTEVPAKADEVETTAVGATEDPLV
jgi:hypothetical protein